MLAKTCSQIGADPSSTSSSSSQSNRLLRTSSSSSDTKDNSNQKSPLSRSRSSSVEIKVTDGPVVNNNNNRLISSSSSSLSPASSTVSSPKINQSDHHQKKQSPKSPVNKSSTTSPITSRSGLEVRSTNPTSAFNPFLAAAAGLLPVTTSTSTSHPCRDPLCRDPTCPTSIRNHQHLLASSLLAAPAPTHLAPPPTHLASAFLQREAILMQHAHRAAAAAAAAAAASGTNAAVGLPYVCNWVAGKLTN